MHSSRAVRPYLRRVVNIGNVLDASVIDRGLAEAFDALHCGVVLTNSEGSILHANGSAEHMQQNGATVQGRNGIPSAKAPAAAQELRKAIRLAARDEAMLGKAGLGIRLTGPKAH
jgi:hypothetical protein